MAVGKIWIEQADPADGGGAGVFLRQYTADFHRDRADGREIESQSLVRVLFLVVPVLPGGSGGGGPGWNCEPDCRMGNVSPGAAVDLLGVPLIPPLPGAAGSGERTRRSRKAARGADCVAEYAHHRGTGARDRGERSYDAHTFAARAHLRRGRGA